MESDADQSALQVAIAEDSRALRHLLISMLQSLGHAVVCAAENGEQLVAACRKTPVDLAIVDLDMPVVDGLAAAEDLWVNQRIPVILISGHSDLQHVIEEHEPVSCCIQKPFAMDDLELAIRKAVRHG